MGQCQLSSNVGNMNLINASLCETGCGDDDTSNEHDGSGEGSTSGYGEVGS